MAQQEDALEAAPATVAESTAQHVAVHATLGAPEASSRPPHTRGADTVLTASVQEALLDLAEVLVATLGEHRASSH